MDLINKCYALSPYSYKTKWEVFAYLIRNR